MKGDTMKNMLHYTFVKKKRKEKKTNLAVCHKHLVAKMVPSVSVCAKSKRTDILAAVAAV